MIIETDSQKFLTFIKIFMPIYWLPKLGGWWFKEFMSRLVYRMEEDWLVREQGVFFFSKKKVPFRSIRLASVDRGPILQLFGGSLVRIRTVGEDWRFREVSFICPADPDGLVEEIMKRAVEAKNNP